jgi:hypothetical protein
MKPAVAALIGMAFLGAAAAHAQQTDKTAAPPEADTGGPGLGEIMTLQQLRHIKLWFAGRAGNWPLADYELGELNEGFEDVGKLLGGDIVDKNVGAALQDLQKIVDAKNAGAFAAAYDRVSAGCNNCHRALDHSFIAIQRPTLLPYSDQNFAPQK